MLPEGSCSFDVHGFHPLNTGKLAMKGKDTLFLPYTPEQSCQVACVCKRKIGYLHNIKRSLYVES
ncbi:hypothetical protein HanPSC8_Chr01g0031851 [Helianthus annuus]|nr:hypothetical protein HanPSC8_Chr01g0031851 [Helianthus annuus]